MADDRSLLVVDDEDSIRSLLRMTLAQAGYDVEEAEDGGRAVEVLNSGDNPFMVDVIICDIRMPRINGVEAIAYFRAQYPSLPVIVLTGYHDEQLASSLRSKVWWSVWRNRRNGSRFSRLWRRL